MSSQHKGRSVVELLGVMDVPAVGRDRLVATAIELCYRRGFNAVGLDQILAEAGVTKTTFYKHFESKDELVVAAIKMRDEWEKQAWMRAVHKLAGDDPRAQLLAMFDVLDLWFNDPIYGGCIFINAAVEYPNPNDPIHQAAAKHKHAFREWVRGLAESCGATDAGAFADAYTILFEGALVMRHVHDRDDAARIARVSIERLIQVFLPASAG